MIITQTLFGNAVLDHVVFIVPVRDLGVVWEELNEDIKERISQLTGYEKEMLR